MIWGIPVVELVSFSVSLVIYNSFLNRLLYVIKSEQVAIISCISFYAQNIFSRLVYLQSL